MTFDIFALGNLPSGWQSVKLGDIVKFEGGSQPPKTVFSSEPHDDYVRLAQIRDFKTDKFATYIPKISAKRFFTEDDIMIGRYGPPIFQILRGLSGSYNVALMKAVPSGHIDRNFLFHLLRSTQLQDFVIRHSQRSAGQTGVNLDLLCNCVVPLPPLAEQIKIAKILDIGDSLLNLRKRSVKMISELPLALFNQLFGAGGKYESVSKLLPLGELVTVKSGGTPNKSKPEYWNGTIPWVSPKDMKPREILESEDHITDLAIAETTIKHMPPESILVVVRGMILAHTVPIRLTRVPVTINQDIKALIPESSVNPLFLRWALQSIHAELLASVSTASHGTKRFETETLLQFRLPIPPTKVQEEFSAAIGRLEQIQTHLDLSAEKFQGLFDALQNQLFNGKTSVAHVSAETAVHV